MTAARNILFKCGDAELQTSTFLAGLDALKRLDDWQIRGRILSFLHLIKSSAIRESLKGQTHLNIEPLTALVDRFHTHDASNPRDKIYALWGLCSDSRSMTRLQPDYKKSWEILFKDLGKIIFGEHCTIAASKHRQMMFVRTAGYDYGRVERIYGAADGRLWEDTLEIGVIPARASRFLINDHGWTALMTVRVATEQLMENDWVLFLPHASKIVFARPARYYLEIIMTVDSRMAHMRDPYSRRLRPWQSWFYDITEDAKEYPLLWNWEKGSEQNEEHSLELMADHISNSSASTDPDRARVLLQAKATSDMAALFIHWEDYHEASELLAENVATYSSVYGPEHEITTATRDQLDGALIQKNTYLKAQELLSDFVSTESPDAVINLCALIILLSINITGTPNLDYYATPIHIWVDLASKVISKGVSKDMILQTLQFFPFPGGTAVNAMLDIAPLASLRPRLREGNLAIQHYLKFLLALAGDDIFISGPEMLTAARRKLGYPILILLAKRGDYPLQKVPEILEVMRARRIPGIYLQSFVTELGDRIVVTPDAINVAAKWDVDALSTLLEAAKGAPVIAPAAFTIAMQNLSASTRTFVELLAQHAHTGCMVPEEAIKLIAWNDQFDKTELQWIFVSLLEHTHLVVDIYELVLFRTSSVLDITDNNVNELLRFRPASHFSRNMHKRMVLRLPISLKDVLASTGPIRQDDIDTISANDIVGYASFINLVRYRTGEFTITEDLIRKVAREPKKQGRRNTSVYSEDEAPHRSLLIVDKCTAFLIRHADKDVVRSLVSSSALVETAAHRGLPHVVEALHNRLSYTLLHFDTLHAVAELCQLLQRPIEVGESLADLPIFRSLIQRLAGMKYKSISDNVKWAIFLHARRMVFYNTVLDLLLKNEILESGTIKAWEKQYRDADEINDWEEQSLDTRAGHQENEIYR